MFVSVHKPSQHWELNLHLISHDPQFCLSVLTSTHRFLQHTPWVWNGSCLHIHGLLLHPHSLLFIVTFFSHGEENDDGDKRPVPLCCTDFGIGFPSNLARKRNNIWSTIADRVILWVLLAHQVYRKPLYFGSYIMAEKGWMKAQFLLLSPITCAILIHLWLINLFVCIFLKLIITISYIYDVFHNKIQLKMLKDVNDEYKYIIIILIYD